MRRGAGARRAAGRFQGGAARAQKHHHALFLFHGDPAAGQHGADGVYSGVSGDGLFPSAERLRPSAHGGQHRAHPARGAGRADGRRRAPCAHHPRGDADQPRVGQLHLCGRRLRAHHPGQYERVERVHRGELHRPLSARARAGRGVQLRRVHRAGHAGRPFERAVLCGGQAHPLGRGRGGGRLCVRRQRLRLHGRVYGQPDLDVHPGGGA